ncbi:hypothetical protein N658DRAFT_123197 [Parathielavia hyrcaniae]|uniref:Uncharacterized protein n=1 Tax=Parathielavia hyrcaniae TaxID=113614 RepID=A0AAN6T607_9PEZI|nr:hypothetical protein N658DRAFT_123197 [Parathielavia hyrcaniae]
MSFHNVKLPRVKAAIAIATTFFLFFFSKCLDDRQRRPGRPSSPGGPRESSFAPKDRLFGASSWSRSRTPFWPPSWGWRASTAPCSSSGPRFTARLGSGRR